MRWCWLLLVVGCPSRGTGVVGTACKSPDDCGPGLSCLADRCAQISCTTSDDCMAGYECTPTRQCQAKTGVVMPTNDTNAPTGHTVKVTVLTHPYAREVSGAVAIINGVGLSTGEDGVATLTAPSVPYDLTVLLPAQTFPGDASFHRPPLILSINGLTRLDPLVRFYDQSPVEHDTLNGTLTSISNIPSNSLASYFFEGAGAYTFGRNQFGSANPTQSYSTQMYRHGEPSAPSGTLRVLLRDDPADVGLTEYMYGNAHIDLADTVGTVTKNITLASVLNTVPVEVHVTTPGASWTVTEMRWFAIFAGHRVEMHKYDAPGVSVTYSLPVISGLGKELQLTLTDTASGATRSAHTVLDDAAHTGAGKIEASVTLEPPGLSAPNAGATLAAGAVFTWTPPSNSTSVMVAKLGTTLEFSCITRGSSCALPNTTAFGAAWRLPTGASGSWRVTSTVPSTGNAPTVDEITGPVLQSNDTLADTYLFDIARNADASTSAPRGFNL